MAIRIDSNADIQFTNVPSGAAWTVSCWAYLSVDRNAMSTLFTAESGSGGVYVQTLADGTSLTVTDWSAAWSGSVALTVGTWYHIALSVNGASGTLYVTPAGGATSTLTSSTVTQAAPADWLAIGGEASTGFFWNGRIAAVKVWSAALSSAEVTAERLRYQPQRTANLTHWYPLTSFTTADSSGSGNTLTPTTAVTPTTPTTEAGPPIAWSGPVPNAVTSAYLRTTAAGTPISRYEIQDPVVSGAAGQMFLYLPGNKPTGTSIKAIIAGHGYTDPAGTFLETHAGGATAAWVDLLADAGYAVIAPEFSATFGNQDAQNRITRAYTYLTTSWTVQHAAYLGFSMGGGTAAVALHRNTIPQIKTALLFSPLVDWDYYTNAGDFGVTPMWNAYGTSTRAAFITATAAWDPSRQPSTSYAGVRVRAASSAGDTAVPRANVTGWLSTVGGGTSTVVSDVSATGEHTESGLWANAAAGVAWLEANIYTPAGGGPATATTFYISAAGSDSNNGTSTSTPWATLEPAYSRSIQPGDAFLFRGGDTFTDPIYVAADGIVGGASGSPVVFGSYGTGRATIAVTSNHGLIVYDDDHATFQDLIVTGSGTSISSFSGVYCYNDTGARLSGITVSNVEVSGFKYGAEIGGNAFGFSGLTVSNSVFRNNRDYGLFAYGAGSYAHTNLTVTGCTAYDNEGNLANTTTHTGSGITVSNVNGGLIDLCRAYSNGADNRATTEGPCGIWAFDSNNVTIQRCVSHDNQAGTNVDGDGFDLDLGSVNCTIQYCLAYNNEGAGFLLFDSGDGGHNNNTVRYNLSWGNGRKNADYGEITIYGSAASDRIYHNTCVSITNGAAQPPTVRINGSAPTGATFRNNLLVSRSTAAVIRTSSTIGTSAALFQGNHYHVAGGGTLVNYNGTTYASLAAWRTAVAGQEQVSGANVGTVSDPLLVAPATAPTVTDPADLTGAAGLKLQTGSAAATGGLDLPTLFSTAVGPRDYFGATLTAPYSVGAAELDASAVDVGRFFLLAGVA